MTRGERIVWIALLAAAAVSISYIMSARAAECPTPEPCKVLTLTPQEEGFLTQQGGILDTAERGRLVDLAGPVRYFRDKIRDAPMGEPARRPSEPAK